LEGTLDERHVGQIQRQSFRPEDGLDHHQISNVLLEEYGIKLYPADILSFLEDSVHLLEAIKDIAELQRMRPLVAEVERHIQRIVR
jgi:superfamily II helicase